MLELFEQLKESLAAHAEFLVVAAVLSLVGRFAKAYVFTKKRAASGKKGWLWARRTLPFHPVVTALVYGAIRGKPVYFAMAGLLSIWFFDVAKSVAKKSADFELEDVFPSSPPPPKDP